MPKKVLTHIFLWATFIFIFLAAILAVHIYLVTRPKAPDAKTIAMARIDIRQNINEQDSAKITNWLHQQKGIDHVLCNIQNRIVVFTFHPVVANGNEIVQKFKLQLAYNAQRFIPTKEQLNSSCPVAANSTAAKIYTYLKNIFKN